MDRPVAAACSAAARRPGRTIAVNQSADMNHLKRRDFLKASAAFTAAAASGSFSTIELANAASMDVPSIDKLAVRVLVDGAFDTFSRPQKVNGVAVEVQRSSDFRRPFHAQWGLSLWLDAQRGADARTLLLDFGHTPEALMTNMELMKVDPGQIKTLILSHGHNDHWGGLVGFLEKKRELLPADVTLYCGGEDNFCQRHAGAMPGPFTDRGVLDRRELAAHRVKLVLAQKPTVIDNLAFTTGQIRRSGVEKVLPNTLVEFGVKNNLGCDMSHFSAAELQGKIMPDEHVHEHATCFNLKDRGLVVISSCGHVGIVNSVRQAQEVSGVRKVHAIMGGFHLGPAPAAYLNQVVAEIRKLEPDAVIPMHCSGNNFIQAVREQMPDKLVLATIGSRIIFGA
jgi:7,8-dihydropterin-6-yl-methyl-4-(beta-D-ribofuranosyl)aminobenzene 5'-phosphate synthase